MNGPFLRVLSIRFLYWKGCLVRSKIIGNVSDSDSYNYCQILSKLSSKIKFYVATLKQLLLINAEKNCSNTFNVNFCSTGLSHSIGFHGTRNALSYPLGRNIRIGRKMGFFTFQTLKFDFFNSLRVGSYSLVMCVCLLNFLFFFYSCVSTPFIMHFFNC